jgi:cell division septation protein DedD
MLGDKKIRMKKIISIFCLALVALTTNAQTFLDNLQKEQAGQGSVTVIEDPEIDSLVNGKGGPVIPDPVVQKPVHKQEVKKTLTPEEEEAENIARVLDTRKKIMSNSYKTQGYRVQVYSGGSTRTDRQQAETTGAVMKTNFPNEPIYVHFYSPSWKCRMGNYKNLNEAREILAKVKKLGYKDACIIKGTITLRRQ